MKRFLLLFLSAYSFMACDHFVPICMGAKECSPVEKEPFRISDRSMQVSSQMQIYDHLNPHDFPKDQANLQEASLAGHLLKLKVSSSGGCRTHVWGLVGSPAIAKSLPPQNNIYLTHNANGDFCEAMIHETLTFDLSPLAEVLKPNQEVVIHVFEPNTSQPFGKSLLFKP